MYLFLGAATALYTLVTLLFEAEDRNDGRPDIDDVSDCDEIDGRWYN